MKVDEVGREIGRHEEKAQVGNKVWRGREGRREKRLEDNEMGVIRRERQRQGAKQGDEEKVEVRKN